MIASVVICLNVKGGPDSVPRFITLIVVLSLHSLVTKRSAVGRNPGKYNYVHGPSTSADEVQFSSIKAFKGLERPVVIVCEMDRITHGDLDNQLYVAFSRAKNHLVVVGPTAAGE